MKRDLCKPCAVELSRNGTRLAPLPGKADKITCAQCGRRRYGLTYETINAVAAIFKKGDKPK